MPDVKDTEKTQIKSRARRFTLDLQDAPLSSGFEIYSKTVDKLYQRSARWKICLKCGTIDKKESLEEISHSCAEGIGKLPVIIPTSWVVLKDFFLTTEYTKTLQKLGVEPISVHPTPVSISGEDRAEVPAATPEEIPVKAGQDNSE